MSRDTITDDEVLEFLRSVGLSPRYQAFLASEAVAARYGLPIFEAQKIVRRL